jgi:hypothetical protein
MWILKRAEPVVVALAIVSVATAVLWLIIGVKCASELFRPTRTPPKSRYGA